LLHHFAHPAIPKHYQRLLELVDADIPNATDIETIEGLLDLNDLLLGEPGSHVAAGIEGLADCGGRGLGRVGQFHKIPK
jgi:hypothetical protein